MSSTCIENYAAVEILRLIIKQANEWQTPLHTNVIDFERGFRFLFWPDLYIDQEQQQILKK